VRSTHDAVQRVSPWFAKTDPSGGVAKLVAEWSEQCVSGSDERSGRWEARFRRGDKELDELGHLRIDPVRSAASIAGEPHPGHLRTSKRCDRREHDKGGGEQDAGNERDRGSDRRRNDRSAGELLDAPGAAG
jgi:hypothetical protein